MNWRYLQRSHVKLVGNGQLKEMGVALKHTTFSPHPLAQLAAAFALGILGELHIAVPLLLLLSIAALTTLIAATTFIEKQINGTMNGKKKLSVATISVMLAALFAGASLATIEQRVPANQLKRLLTEGTIAPGTAGEGTIALGQPVEITGVLERDPEVAPERLYLFLRVEKLRLKSIEREVSGEVVLLAPVSGKLTEQEFAELDLRYGARIRVMTNLERSDSFRNPAVSSFTEHLDRKRYDATDFVKSPLLIETSGKHACLPAAGLALRMASQAASGDRLPGRSCQTGKCRSQAVSD